MLPFLRTYENAFMEARKHTSYRDFLMEVASWQPASFYKSEVGISRYPKSDRLNRVVSSTEFGKLRDGLIRTTKLAQSDRSFFDVFREMFRSVETPALFQNHAENSDYADCNGRTKNAYLSIIANHGENILYSFSIKSADNVFGSVGVWDDCENIYSCSGVTKSTNIFYSRYLDNCQNVWFSRNMIGCQECIFCEGLENSTFYINNIQYSKEDYFRKKEEILSAKSEFETWYRSMPKDSRNLAATNVTGTFISGSEDVENGHWIYHVKNARNAIFTGWGTEKTDLYDTVTCGAAGHMYATVNGVFFSEYVFGCISVVGCSHTFYSFNLSHCSYCIGCIGLQNKTFCIYNEQYSQEEWEVLAEKIFSGMVDDGSFGKFFLPSTNPFYFNDTLASFIDDTFTREEAMNAGFLWRDEPARVDIPEGAEVIESKRLCEYETAVPSWRVSEEVLEKTIRDEQGNLYRITSIEIDFLNRYGLPLPRTSWIERFSNNLKSPLL